jgi:hypothetical protein
MAASRKKQSGLGKAAGKIKHKGVVKKAAKKAGVSTHQELKKLSHMKGNSPAAKKARARGNLGLALSKSAKRRKKK